jgi:hypothetical protein
VIDDAEDELRHIRALLNAPTPENFQAAQNKLEYLAGLIASVKDELCSGRPCERRVWEFLRRLPGEMQRIRTLMQTPIEFYRSLDSLWATQSESYDVSGNVRGLASQVGPKTLLQL